MNEIIWYYKTASRGKQRLAKAKESGHNRKQRAS
jgi:hypothetical protein